MGENTVEMTSAEVQRELRRNSWEKQAAAEEIRNVKDNFAGEILAGIGNDIRREIRRPTSTQRYKKPLRMRIGSWFDGFWQRLVTVMA